MDGQRQFLERSSKCFQENKSIKTNNNLKPKTQMKKFEAIKKIIAEMENDVNKFYDGTNAAGTRVRKACQEIKAAANELRADVQKVRESRKK